MNIQPVSPGLFTHPDFDDHEMVCFASDQRTGLKAIIAVHDTTLGPALGGCRRWRYASEAEAVRDVLRLSRGMTLKNAAAGLDLGGGKSVILSDGADATPQLWRAFAKALNRLGGDYITAEDVGTGQQAVDHIAEASAHVRGTSATGLGDPSPYTAWGVYQGIRAAARHALGARALEGLTIAVQGTGNVGAGVARLARADGARLILADIRKEAVDALAAELGGGTQEVSTCGVEDILAADCDVLAPCALGGALNARTIPRIRAKIVAGAANNQLESADDAMRLAERGILYAPDFVINSGGVISIALAGEFPDEAGMKQRVGALADILTGIFERAEAGEGTSDAIAVRIAQERIAAARPA